MKYAILKVN